MASSGVRCGNKERCDPFTVTDAHSRYIIRCQAVPKLNFENVDAICDAVLLSQAFVKFPNTISLAMKDASERARQTNKVDWLFICTDTVLRTCSSNLRALSWVAGQRSGSTSSGALRFKSKCPLRRFLT